MPMVTRPAGLRLYPARVEPPLRVVCSSYVWRSHVTTLTAHPRARLCHRCSIRMLLRLAECCSGCSNHPTGTLDSTSRPSSWVRAHNLSHASFLLSGRFCCGMFNLVPQSQCILVHVCILCSSNCHQRTLSCPRVQESSTCCASRTCNTRPMRRRMLHSGIHK